MGDILVSKARTIHIPKKGIWTPTRKNFEMIGKVSDIRVFDDYDPRTGKGKLIDYHKGGHNTISSGATATMLEYLFGLGIQDPFPTRYFDGSYYFPGIPDISNGSPAYSAGLSTINPLTYLFGNLVGINGGAGGLAGNGGKQSALANMNWAWILYWNTNTLGFASGDQYNVAGSVTKTITMTRSLTTSGQPAQYTWNVTVTSSQGAQPYTIDSVGWVPMATINGLGYFGLSAQNGNARLGVNNVTPTLSSASAAPSNVSTYITALFVLPYLITVNPKGAFQFTYTFQGN